MASGDEGFDSPRILLLILEMNIIGGGRHSNSSNSRFYMTNFLTFLIFFAASSFLYLLSRIFTFGLRISFGVTENFYLTT